MITSRTVLGGAGLLAVGFLLLARVSTGVDAQAQPARPAGEIVARGHIEPLGRVIAISGPPGVSSTVALVSKLQVDQGSKVQPGQVVAILEGYDLANVELEGARASLDLAMKQRAQVQAGAGKSSEIAAQVNFIASRKAQLVRAKKDYERTVELQKSNNASPQELDARRAALDQAQNDVLQSENTLKSLTEVRTVDNAVASAQIAVAQANLARAQAVIERLRVRAPAAGTVLSIQSRAGEAVGADGILRMGDIDRLIVVAEVDQSQIGRVKEGMPARIEGDLVGAGVDGTVTRIAREVFRQKRPTSDILTGRDAKIVEVEVTPKTPLAAVIGAEVTVRFRGSAGP